jgi:hypothetical protein
MAVLKTIKNIFSPSSSSSQNLFDFQKSNDEINRIRHFQKLWDYYSGDSEEIVRYLKQALVRTFSMDDISEMQIPFYNITRRIIDRTSIAYFEPAERYLIVTEGKPEEKKQAALYQEVLNNSNIHISAKQAHKLAKLMDTCYIAPVWRGDHIDYDVFPAHLISVIEKEDNYLEPSQIMYRVVKTEKDGTQSTQHVYWSESKKVITDDTGKVITDEPNPYGLLQFIPLRVRETENHWGEGDTQLIEINEKINVLLVSLYDNAIMQAHGQPFGVNLGSNGKLKTGPRHLIEAENVRADQAQPSFQFVSPNPAIDEVTRMVDWMVKTVCVQRGLPAFSVSTEATAQSGAAKAIDILELQEIREDDIQYLRMFEKKLFEATKAVWNYHAKEQIKDTMQFGIDFADISPEPPEKEVLLAKQMKLNMGLWTPVDDFIDEDEGITKEDAFKMVEENLAIRNQLNDEFGIMKTFSQPDINGEMKIDA